jgi:hypothetical protein
VQLDRKIDDRKICERTHEERASFGIGVNPRTFRVFPGYWFAEVIANDAT